jgi:hypothetical protein
VDGQQARLAATRNAIWLGTGQINGEGIERHWADFREELAAPAEVDGQQAQHSGRPWARAQEARHLLSMSGSETPDDPDDSDDGPPPLEGSIPLEDPSTAPPGDIVRAGVRTRRLCPLNANDLYEGTARPEVLTTEDIYQQCGICLHVKSHPVSYVFLVLSFSF